MTKAKLAGLRRVAEQIEQRRRLAIEALADEARTAILPYFAKRHWSYKSGNGTWFIDRRDGSSVEDDQLPAWLHDMLYLELGRDDLLGFWISDIEAP